MQGAEFSALFSFRSVVQSSADKSVVPGWLITVTFPVNGFSCLWGLPAAAAAPCEPKPGQYFFRLNHATQMLSGRQGTRHGGRGEKPRLAFPSQVKFAALQRFAFAP